MQCTLSVLLAVGMSGIGAHPFWQHTTPPPAGDQAGPTFQHREGDETNGAHSARTFTGRIVRSDKQFVLKDRDAHISYALDDQIKAREFRGRLVKVLATMDSSSSTLHVIEIIDSGSR